MHLRRVSANPVLAGQAKPPASWALEEGEKRIDFHCLEGGGRKVRLFAEARKHGQLPSACDSKPNGGTSKIFSTFFCLNFREGNRFVLCARAADAAIVQCHTYITRRGSSNKLHGGQTEKREREKGKRESLTPRAQHQTTSAVAICLVRPTVICRCGG